MKRVFALAVFLGVLPVFAMAQSLDVSKSSIRVVARQMNVPMQAQFRKFNAEIAWDDAHPENSKARVEVEPGSFDLGEPSFNEEARGKDFFSAAAFPKAVFTSSSVKSLGSGKYEVAGKLAMKGITRDMVASFTVKTEGATRVFDTSFSLKRLDYKIGEGAWTDTDTLANDTQVQVHLVMSKL